MNGADGAALRTYTEREIESMETQDLLNLYKETGSIEMAAGSAV